MGSMTEPLADEAVFAVNGATGASGGRRGVDGVRAHRKCFDTSSSRGRA